MLLVIMRQRIASSETLTYNLGTARYSAVFNSRKSLKTHGGVGLSNQCSMPSSTVQFRCMTYRLIAQALRLVFIQWTQDKFLDASCLRGNHEASFTCSDIFPRPIEMSRHGSPLLDAAQMLLCRRLVVSLVTLVTQREAAWPLRGLYNPA